MRRYVVAVVFASTTICCAVFGVLYATGGLGEQNYVTLPKTEICVIPDSELSYHEEKSKDESILVAAPAESLPKVVNEVVSYMSYTVKSGDTVSGIARRHATSVSLLLGINGLSEAQARKIQIGQKLQVPIKKDSIEQPPSSAKQTHNPKDEVIIGHAVDEKLGDESTVVIEIGKNTTWGEFSVEKGIEINILRQYNMGVTPKGKLVVGQIVFLPYRK